MRSYFTMNALSILSLAAIIGCDGVEIDGVEYQADDAIFEAEEAPSTALAASDELTTHATTLAPSGSWTITGSTTVYHGGGQAAVTLPTGKIFALSNNPNNPKVAEIYDPATGAWSIAAPPTKDHTRGVVVGLSNGKVLAIGGYSSTNFTSSGTERYDPATNTWTNVSGGPRIDDIGVAQAVTLPNGKVLVAGDGDIWTLSRSAKIYDPTLNKWTITGNMIDYRANFGMVVLPNGKVLAAGGSYFWTGTPGSHKAELYDPGTGTWTATGDLNGFHTDATATLLADGKVLLVGAGTPELYDPATGTWSLTGTPPIAFTNHSAIRLGSSKVLIAGGAGKKAQLYDPSTGAWTVANDMNFNRFSWPAMSTLPGGLILVSSAALNQTEIYTP